MLQQSRHVQQVANWYKKSFQELRTCPMPLDGESEEKFYKVINSIYERHSTTLMTMAKGAHEIRSMLGHDTMTFAEQDDIQRCLDEFYMSRIGVRMLIGQYLTLRSSTAEDIEEGRIGQVTPCSLRAPCIIAHVHRFLPSSLLLTLLLTT